MWKEGIACMDSVRDTDQLEKIYKQIYNPYKDFQNKNQFALHNYKAFENWLQFENTLWVPQQIEYS